MVINAHERLARGQFKAEDLIRDAPDSSHPKPYVEGKSVSRWVAGKVRYLEWGSERAPKLFRRPTFPELYAVAEKLISVDLAGGGLRVCYDSKQLYHNHSAWSFVPWQALSGVRNTSIAKSATYQNEVGASLGRDRRHLEDLSGSFDLKFVLAVMNSRFAERFLFDNRRSRLHIYPDDWKQLPIPHVPRETQQPIVECVDRILTMLRKEGQPYLDQIAVLEQEINTAVDALIRQATPSIASDAS